MKEYSWWKSSFGGRVHLVYESVGGWVRWWKSPFGRIVRLVEETSWWKSPGGERIYLTNDLTGSWVFFTLGLTGLRLFSTLHLTGSWLFLTVHLAGSWLFLTVHSTGSRLFSTLDLTGLRLFWGQKMAIRPTPLPGNFWSLPNREEKKNIYKNVLKMDQKTFLGIPHCKITFPPLTYFVKDSNSPVRQHWAWYINLFLFFSVFQQWLRGGGYGGHRNLPAQLC